MTISTMNNRLPSSPFPLLTRLQYLIARFPAESDNPVVINRERMRQAKRLLQDGSDPSVEQLRNSNHYSIHYNNHYHKQNHANPQYNMTNRYLAHNVLNLCSLPTAAHSRPDNKVYRETPGVCQLC